MTVFCSAGVRPVATRSLVAQCHAAQPPASRPALLCQIVRPAPGRLCLWSRPGPACQGHSLAEARVSTFPAELCRQPDKPDLLKPMFLRH